MTEKWTEISREEVFKKYSRKIEKVIFKLPNGEESDFYIKAEGPASSILAITREREVILVKQFRPGPKQVLLELPGGYVNNGEDPSVAASRELLEETGYEGKVASIGICLDDAYSTMKRHCFVATDCIKIGEPEQTQTERVEVELMPLDSFREHLRSGELTDVEVGYLGLDYLGLL